jgi:Fur family ferric uptake transcriptional regulator
MLQFEDILISKNIRPTANRILVAKCLDSFNRPISIAEIEESISTMDKSSIFRALTRFVENDVVHVIDDGSGALKYELCHGEHGHSLEDMHAHFRCELCGRVFCLESKHIPIIELPSGFSAMHINYVIQGICSDCKK